MRDDIDFNTSFCKLVERHPALYDYMRPDYCNRSVQDRIWRKIGKELNEKAQDCRDRWKNIRARYLKTIKERERNVSTDKIVKEYYLAQHLQFLYKYLKRGKVNKKITDDKYSDEEILLSQDDSQRSISSSPSLPHFLSVSQSVETPAKSSSENYQDKDVKTNPNEAVDPDMAFLQSVLPDMKAMNDEQKRKFKIAVLNMAGQILSEKPCVLVEDSSLKLEENNWLHHINCSQVIN